MRRLWTESGARRARWWRPRWPPMPPPRWSSVCPQIDQVDDLIDDLALFTRLQAGAVSGLGIVRAGDPGRGLRPAAALVEAAAGRRRAEAGRHQHPEPLAAGSQPRDAASGRPARSASATRWPSRSWPNGWWKTDSSTPRRSSCPASSPSAAESSTSSRPTGMGRSASSSSATRSNRSGGSRFPASGAWSRWTAVDVTILGPGAADRAHLADYLPPQSWFLLLEPMELEQQGRQYLERTVEAPGDGSSGQPSPEAEGQGSAEQTPRPNRAFHPYPTLSVGASHPHRPTPCRKCGRCSAFPRWRPRPWRRRRWKPPAG